MSSTTIFYILAVALVLLALGTAAIGIRNKDFPSPMVFRVGILLFALLVAVTGVFAVANARDEAEHRDEELAAEGEPETSTEPEGKPAPGPGSPPPAEPGGATVTFTVVPGTELAYTETAITAPAGKDKIVLDNPQDVGHDVAIAEGAQVIGKTEVTVKGEVDATVDLTPGAYVFYCTVPGHRESGMEGELTVE